MLLVSRDSSASIGVMQRGHELVPERARSRATALFPTIVVDDVDSVFARAKELCATCRGAEKSFPWSTMPYGGNMIQPNTVGRVGSVSANPIWVRYWPVLQRIAVVSTSICPVE